MATEKQVRANRENAKKGGVKTQQGKAISRYNALKHGLLSEKVLMKGENQNELEDVSRKIRNDLKPSSIIEVLLTDRIIANFWRLRRVMELEKNGVLSDYGLTNYSDIFFRYETILERGIYKALHELQRIQSARAGNKTPLPVAIDIDVSGVKE